MSVDQSRTTWLYSLANDIQVRGILVTDSRELVSLLHRADWTRLSLSAEVNDGSALVIAPGMRYRYRTDDYMTGCDGGRPWELAEDKEADRGNVHWVGSAEATLPRLLCPAWLLERSGLELRGRTRFRGREALDVVMTRRISLAGGSPDDEDAVEVVIDAETGIVLRLAERAPGGDLVELVCADFTPVTDVSRFQPPPGSQVAEGIGEFLPPALRVVGGLAAGALGAWMRYSRSRRTPPTTAHSADLASVIEQDEPPPDQLTDNSVSDVLLSLLHAGGTTTFAATLDRRMDVGAMAAAVPPSARRAGLGGLGLLAGLSGQGHHQARLPAASRHRTARRSVVAAAMHVVGWRIGDRKDRACTPVHGEAPPRR